MYDEFVCVFICLLFFVFIYVLVVTSLEAFALCKVSLLTFLYFFFFTLMSRVAQHPIFTIS